MRKRLFSVILSVVMLLGLLPADIIRADNLGQIRNIYIGTSYYQGADLYDYSDSYVDDKGEHYTWKWDHSTHTMYLNGYEGPAMTFEGVKGGVAKVNVVVENNSENKFSSVPGYPNLGIIYGSLSITGPGKLCLSADKFDFYSCIYAGYTYSDADINIDSVDIEFDSKGNAGIMSTTGDISLTGKTSVTGSVEVFGIGAGNKVTIDGDVSLNYTVNPNSYPEMQAEAIGTDINAGIYSNYDDIEIKGNTKINIKADGNGIYAIGKKLVLRTSGSVDIDANEFGLRAGTVVSVGGKGDLNIKNAEFGICAEQESVILSGSGKINLEINNNGIVESKIVSGSNYYFTSSAICAHNDVTINRNGLITIKAIGDNTVNGIEVGGSLVDAKGNPIENKIGDVTVLGKSIVDIDVNGYGILFGDEEKDHKLLLEGSGSPISIKSGTDKIAILNGKSGTTSVGGSKLSDYSKVTGDPSGNMVIYEIPEPNPTPTPSEEPTPTPTKAPTPTPTKAPTPTPTSAPKKDIGEFVARCYDVALGREPDEGGYDYWCSQLKDGKNCGAQVGYGFIFSGEYIAKNTDNEQFLKDLYSMYFGREPDEAGFEYWLNLLNSGMAREEVFAGFANSLEFHMLCSDYGVVSGYFVPGILNEQQGGVNCFVARLYNVCLNRLPDLEGQALWVLQLLNGQASGSTVAFGFVFSPEFVNNNYDNGTYVELLYKAFFNREADEGGYNAWVDQLNAGMSREEVFAGFSNSAEFINLCASYGIIA